jgi:hypothetical protein
MAAIKQVIIAEGAVPAPRISDPHTELARLAELHTEAQETALLANLVGRAPYAMMGLAVAAGISVALAADDMPAAQIAAWLILMIAGLGAMARAYSRAIAAPFERAALKAFEQDLTAMSVYLGFAWGAGAFLMLPSVIPFSAVTYAAVTSAGFAALLKDRKIALCFIGPAAMLSALACVLRPLPGGSLAAMLVLAASAAVACAVVFAARIVPTRASLQPG